MNGEANDDTQTEVEDWWRTEIISMRPNDIRYRGYAIDDLIGNIGFADMIWLMLRGDLPKKVQSRLLEAALMSGVDHGPQAPSIAIARMAATCGVDLNSAMASALNVLGDAHGGAGEQAVELYELISNRLAGGTELKLAVVEEIDRFQSSVSRFIPGFGHRFHTADPRSPRLLALVDHASEAGDVSGKFAEIGRAIETELHRRKGRSIPMNIDGATAVIYAELGFAAPLARGIFCLSRSVGIMAHAWEQSQQGVRNKGPIPRRMLPTYDGPSPRRLFPDATSEHGKNF